MTSTSWTRPQPSCSDASPCGLAGRRWLVVVARREWEGGFTAPDDAPLVEIPLEPLDPAAARLLVQELTETAPVGPRRRCGRRAAGGNPLRDRDRRCGARGRRPRDAADSVEALLACRSMSWKLRPGCPATGVRTRCAVHPASFVAALGSERTRPKPCSVASGAARGRGEGGIGSGTDSFARRPIRDCRSVVAVRSTSASARLSRTERRREVEAVVEQLDPAFLRGRLLGKASEVRSTGQVRGPTCLRQCGRGGAARAGRRRRPPLATCSTRGGRACGRGAGQVAHTLGELEQARRRSRSPAGAFQVTWSSGRGSCARRRRWPRGSAPSAMREACQCGRWPASSGVNSARPLLSAPARVVPRHRRGLAGTPATRCRGTSARWRTARPWMRTRRWRTPRRPRPRLNALGERDRAVVEPSRARDLRRARRSRGRGRASSTTSGGLAYYSGSWNEALDYYIGRERPGIRRAIRAASRWLFQRR